MHHTNFLWVVCFLSASIVCLPAEKVHAQAGCRINLERTMTFGAGEEELYQLADMATDSAGYLYVTDMVDNRIKKFSPCGSLLWQTGGRGRSNGFFEAIRLVRCAQGRIYITDQYRSGIQVFDSNGRFLNRIAYGPPIIDLCPESKNRFWVEPLLFDKGGILACIDSSGALIEEREIEVLNRSVLSVFSFIRAGLSTALAFKFLDRILFFDPEGKIIWEAGCDLPVKQSAKKIFGWMIPAKTVYKDIAADTSGYFYVLGGHFSENNSSDIYILDGESDHIATITLDEPTHCLHIDHENNLYARSKLGSQIIKYRISYTE